MSDKPTLKPCPFCGYDVVELHGYRVKCLRCKAYGPEHEPTSTRKLFDDQERRAELWNQAPREKPTVQSPAICPFCMEPVIDDAWKCIADKGSKRRETLHEYWHRECRLDYERVRQRGWLIRLFKWLLG